MDKNKIISKIETFTHNTSNQNKAIEVLLIGVDTKNVGKNNNLQPPNFNEKHITNWIKKRYLFSNKTLYAQIPIKFSNYPKEVLNEFNYESIFISDVCFKDNFIHIYYIINSKKCVCLTWNVYNNRWSMKLVKQPSESNNIDLDKGHAKDKEIFWSSN